MNLSTTNSSSSHSSFPSLSPTPPNIPQPSQLCSTTSCSTSISSYYCSISSDEIMAEGGSGTKPSERSSVRINISGTRYGIVRQVADLLEMSVTEEDNDIESDILWIDTAVPVERYLQLRPHQILNHFPGMGEICRKDSLARNIQRFKRIKNSDYNIMPMTWVLPSEYGSLIHFVKELKRRRRTKTFIVKPPNGAMGNGITLTRNIEHLSQGESLIVQEYIEKPLLLDGFKFDLRVYVLITSCTPLRAFIYKDGLVRLSTQTYSPPTDTNIGQQFMHLTNYSINKHSHSFDKDESFDRGSKRSLQYFNGWLIRNSYNIVELWSRIHDLLVKTLIVAQPHVQHSYQACRPGISSQDKSQCFEILGFDILIDENLRPWLLEVNRSPSFGIDTKLDYHIKTGVISDAIKLLDIKPSDKAKKLSLQRIASRRRLLQSSMSTRGSTLSKQPLDFVTEHEESVMMLERKREEVRNRLLEVRRNKELEQHEKECMGEYQRLFPSPDPQKQIQYEILLADSAKIGYAGRTHTQSHSVVRGLDKMRERELLDLLSQYESEEKFNCVPTTSNWVENQGIAALSAVQPLSLVEPSPMEAAMAAREHEEEQTQRTMLALNTLQPSYPGKEQEEVNKVYKEIQSNWTSNQSDMESFWLLTLDGIKRKQLLSPIRESVKNLIRTVWRSTLIDSIKLYRVFLRLFNFLLASHGQGLWSTLTVENTVGDHWEKQFQRKYEVLSMSELHCCRRIAELCQATVIAAYYYHVHLNTSREKKGKRISSQTFPTRRRSDTILRHPPPPLSLSTRRPPHIIQLYSNTGGINRRGKSRSVPSFTTTSYSLTKPFNKS